MYNSMNRGNAPAMPQQAGGGLGGGFGGQRPMGGAPAGVGNPAGQYGANADPSGNAYGQAFMQQYGQAPGQMRDQWDAYRAANGIGGGAPDPVAAAAAGIDPVAAAAVPGAMPALPAAASPTAVAQLAALQQARQGNGWGNIFKQLYGGAPGQMRSQWDAMRAARDPRMAAGDRYAWLQNYMAQQAATAPAATAPAVGGLLG